MSIRNWLRWGIALSCLLWLAGTASACPTCRDGLAQDAAHANLVQGYFWSILFMMAMPFVLFFSLGTYFYLSIRKARLAAVTEDALSLRALAAVSTHDPASSQTCDYIAS